jgi:hypothetical protein
MPRLLLVQRVRQPIVLLTIDRAASRSHSPNAIKSAERFEECAARRGFGRPCRDIASRSVCCGGRLGDCPARWNSQAWQTAEKPASHCGLPVLGLIGEWARDEVAMRSEDRETAAVSSFVSCEARVPIQYAIAASNCQRPSAAGGWRIGQMADRIAPSKRAEPGRLVGRGAVSR